MMTATATQVLPAGYGVGTDPRESSEVKIQKSIRRISSQRPPVLDVPDSTSPDDPNPFGRAKRLLGPHEASDLYGIARTMAVNLERAQSERARVDEQIQLLVEQRMRHDSTVRLMRQGLRAYSKVVDIEDLLPEDLK